MSSLTIIGKTYRIIDTKEKMTVPDCFVLPSNKIGKGNGEAKFYVGNENKETRKFFGVSGFSIKCFLLKKDLVSYLLDCKSEYQNPEQNYRDKDNLSTLYNKRLEKIDSLDNVLLFELNEQIQIKGPRVYVKSSSIVYKLIRELSLPNITYLSAIKLKNENNELEYYFRLFIDYFGEEEHPSVIEEEENSINDEADLSAEKQKHLVSARVGQGKYRKALLEECPFCPITLISDDRLLIASHIKPWVKSNKREKIDPKNGFMLTPTFDFLFDRGFISFTNDKKLIISPWLSNMTCSKLNISPNKKYSMLPLEGRKKYLEYHRNNILKS